MRPAQSRCLRASALFVLLTLAAWPMLFVRGQVPVDINLFTVFFPDWALFRHGFFLWNPFREMGCPFLADPQSLAGYPIQWLLKPFGFLTYLRLWVLLHSAIAFHFTRRLSRQWGYGETASLAAGILAAFNGFFTARLSLVNHFASAAYLPAVLYFQSIESAPGMGITLALQWSAGFPPFSLLTILFSGLLAGVQKRGSLRLWGQSLLWAGGLAAYQGLPFLELIRHSVRGIAANAAAAGQFSHSPRQLAKILLAPQWSRWLPGLTGDQAVTSFYIGPVAILLCLLALRRGSRRTALLAAVGGFACLLSLGRTLPFFAVLRPLHLFRFPANWLLLVAMIAALLAAKGLDSLKSAKLRWGILLLLALDLTCFLREPRIAWFDESFLTAPPPAALALRDLVTHPARLYHQDAVVQQFDNSRLATADNYQVMKDFLMPSYGSAFGLRGANSTQVLKLRSTDLFQQRLMREGPQSPLVREASLAAVIVKTAVAAPLDAAHLKLVRVADALPLGRCRLPCTVEELESRGSTHRWRVTSKTDNDWIWGEVNDGNWKGLIDGQPTAVGLHEDLFCRLHLPAGNHELQLTYRPALVRTGFILSSATFAVWIVCAFL